MTTLYKFETGGREVTYLDTDDAYQPEDIRTHWAGTFPELGNASTDIDKKKQTVTHEGNEVEVDRVVTFAKKVGTKGANDTAWQITNALLSIQPADLTGIETLQRLTSGEIATVADLLALQPEIAQAEEQMAGLAKRSQELIKRCLQLTAQPSPRLPSGF